MRVCVVGSGGREHALALALSRTAEVVCTPGNVGMATVAECVPGPPEDVDADLFVIGPDGLLVGGLADRLRAAGRRVFGPGAQGARLEGSKAWMKDVLVRAGVPTARHAAFGDPDAAAGFLASLPGPYVVKTDGLAEGKGVLVTDSLDEAIADARAKLAGDSFGDAGRRVVIEEAMSGPELSVFVLTDGHRLLPLAAARDYKRLDDGDEGPNTGGMGAYTPVDGADEAYVGEVIDRIVAPTLAELVRQGIDYRGVLYAGLMLTPDGPKVVEYNVRFGDPEAQVVLPLVESDVAELFAAVADGDLAGAQVRLASAAVVDVVMASAGYPAAKRGGDVITGVEAASQLDGVAVLHGGTALGGDGSLMTAGGRVLHVTARAPTLAEARARAYDAVSRIAFDGAQWRRDIAGHGMVGR